MPADNAIEMTAHPRTARGRYQWRGTSALLIWLIPLVAVACGRTPAKEPDALRPSILLVTLDTTRADAIGPGAAGVETPTFDGLAARGRRFLQAYATVPETLPSHASMMTGLYPAGHGIHENGRHLSTQYPVVAEQLHSAGYRTAAFMSSFVLARRFGLARGFEVYDDELPAGRAERTAMETTTRAIDYLSEQAEQPLFLWVHYFDPHAPYDPPEPFRSQYPASPYLGEVAAMDEALGRLVAAFERTAPGPVAVVVAGDHGEGLGDHGESQHGLLLYESTMRVPLVVVGPGATRGAVDEAPVSTRRVYHTLLSWAGLGLADSLLAPSDAVVLGEAMKPFLSYGWQPQVMAVSGRQKAILTSRLELYDLATDPGERRDLGSSAAVPAEFRAAMEDYPVPGPEAARASDELNAEARERLASLGYVSAGASPVVRRGAPRPADMAHLFDVLDRTSGLFVAAEYEAVIPLLEEIIQADPYNLDAVLRLATSHSSLGHAERATDAFRRALALAPRSPDVRLYAALHQARGADWARAAPVLEELVQAFPNRLASLEGLAAIRERQGRLSDATALWQRVYALRPATAGESVELGRLAMAAQRTADAIAAFEQARTAQGVAFAYDLELGVLYLSARDYAGARDALDRVPTTHAEYPMALFKRAQVSVLLGESDRAARVARAREHADATTRPLIAAERLFQGGRVP